MGNEVSHQSAPRFSQAQIHATSNYTPPEAQQTAQDPQRRQTHMQNQAPPHSAGGWVAPSSANAHNNAASQNKVYPNLPAHNAFEQTKHAQATMQQNPTAPPMFYPQPAAVPPALYPQPTISTSVTASSATAFYPAAAANANVPFNVNDIWSKGNHIPHNAFRAGHDTDGAVIYICRAAHEGDLLPGKRIPTHCSAYLPYCGKEIPTNNFEILVGYQYKWVPASNGHIPPGAVEGGRTARGEKLFIGRASHDRSLTPGKIHPSHGCLYIPYGGQEICYKEYEVLVHSNY